jgi:hypothetical protein
MIYELRQYHVVPGRMPDLLRRFDEVTLGFWKTYGFRPLGFWTVVIGESNQDLFYMLQWDSLADREKKWAAFQADTNWIAKRADSEKNGPLVASLANTILQPTAFSALK